VHGLIQRPALLCLARQKRASRGWRV